MLALNQTFRTCINHALYVTLHFLIESVSTGVNKAAIEDATSNFRLYGDEVLAVGRWRGEILKRLSRHYLPQTKQIQRQLFSLILQYRHPLLPSV